ncbi:MAG: 2-C-methyl-D-erythritol 4-phosphate cytidylyltransferase [Actinobacteria bacterium]|nr:2-C-methyl-D-erythritol 4-phosphate cytidylyltransferase [Actinomycetota bacterium]
MTPSSQPAAILVAGGRGERARSDEDHIPKQFRPLAGRSVIAWSYDALRAAGCDPVVVVALDEFYDLVRTTLGAEVILAPAGPDRQTSVRNGLEKIDSEVVVIHDAVRPFLTKEMVGATLDALADHEGAIIAAPVDETIKRVEGSEVAGTVDRKDLWRAQTPQSFRSSVIKDAHARALADGFEVTDDAALLESYGGTVAVVPGDNRNLKITYAEDFALAEAFLATIEGSG